MQHAAEAPAKAACGVILLFGKNSQSKLQLTKPSKDFLKRKAERLKRAIARNPSSAILHQGLGRTYSDLKSFTEARHCFVKSLRLDPTDL